MVPSTVRSGSTSGRISGASPASSRTRPAKSARAGVPSLIPPSRKMALPTFSIARISLSTVLRATRSERQSRDWRDLTWTCRYQPVRMIWASARASAVGLVRHRLHGRLGLTRLDAEHRQAGRAKVIVQPGCERAGFQADALQRQIESRHGSDEHLRLALRPGFLGDAPRL